MPDTAHVVDLDDVTDEELQALADACASNEPDLAYAAAETIADRLDPEPDPDVVVDERWCTRLIGLGALAELERRRAARDAA